MFVLKKNPVTPCPVSWLSRDDAGATVSVAITLGFVRIPAARFDALFGEGSGVNGTVTRVFEANRDLVLELAASWSGVVDEAGRVPPFDPEQVGQMVLAEPGFAAAVAQAYVSFYIQVPEAVLGNSGASPAGGPVAADAKTADRTDTASRSRPRSGPRGKTKPA